MSDPPADWPGPDERRTIEVMLIDANCWHWNLCDAWIDGAVKGLYPDLESADHGAIANRVKLHVRLQLRLFRLECPLKSWILKILHNEVVSFYRSGSGIRRHETSLEALQERDQVEQDSPPFEPLASDDTEQLVLLRELLEDVWDVIRTYVATRDDSVRAAHIIDLWLEGVRPKDIADQLSLPTHTVNNTISRLRPLLRRLVRQSLAETTLPTSTAGDESVAQDDSSTPKGDHS